MDLSTFIKCSLLKYGKNGIEKFKIMIIDHELDEHGIISDDPLFHPTDFEVYEASIKEDEEENYLLIKVMYFEDDEA